MDIIAIILAALSSYLLWNTSHQVLKWTIIGAAAIAWYLRQVVASIERRAGLIEAQVARFWAHTCVISFWVSVILSIIGIIKAF